jgi:hypothetical protein
MRCALADNKLPVLLYSTSPALTRIQRAAREYASSRVHVINSEQTLMQIWGNVSLLRASPALLPNL